MKFLCELSPKFTEKRLLKKKIVPNMTMARKKVHMMNYMSFNTEMDISEMNFYSQNPTE